MPRFQNFTGIEHTYATQLSVGPGTVNNLGVKTTKQIININTAFRDDYNTTQATDFSMKLPQPIRKVISLRLYDYHIPTHNYSISQHYHNNNFIISRIVDGLRQEFYINVPDGMYTYTNIADLELAISNSITQYSDLSDIIIDINPLTLKTQIYTDNSLNPFQLDFSYKSSQINKQCATTAKIDSLTYKDHLTLGWILGFRGDYIKTQSSVKSANPQYPSTAMSQHYSRCMHTFTKDLNSLSFRYTDPSGYIYESESLLDLGDDNYLMIAVDDYQNNHNTLYLSPFKDQSLSNPSIIGKISDDKQSCIYGPSRIYFGPTDIDKLHITIYDSYGRIYNNNYGDYSIELLVETVYDGS